MAKEMTLSWSALETWMKCRQKDYLRQTGHKLKGADIRTFFPGTVADRLMRAWLHDPVPGMLGHEDLVEQSLTDEEDTARVRGDGVVKWRGPDDRAQVKAKIIRGLGLLEPVLTERVIPYQYVPEWRFREPLLIPDLNGDYKRVQLVGGMDILVTNPERTWYDVYDLKFTENKDYARTKKGQLTFYDVVTKLKLGQTCRTVAILQPLIEQEPIHRFDITDDDRSYLMNQMVEMANARWRQDIATTENKNDCYQCDVAHACVKFISPRGGKK